MIPQFNIVKPDSLLADLRVTVNKMISNQQTTEERQKQNELITNITHKKLEESLSQEVKLLKAELTRKTTEIQELNKKLDEQEHEVTNNFRREFRHLSDTLVEKEAQIQYLNKQAQKYKSRITSLQQDLVQANSSKESLEQSLMKTIELIKSQFKELFDTKQDLDLNNFMSETNLKQVNDKLDALLNICVDLEKKKIFMEDKYAMLKRDHNEQIDRNIKLEVELEKVRQQLWQEKRIVENFNNNKKFAAEEVEYFSKKSKASRLSAGPSQFKSQQNQHQESAYVSDLEDTISLLKVQTNMLLKFEEKLINMNKKINEETNIWREVMTVKELNTGLQRELNHLKQQINPEHHDKLMKSKHPKLYEFFSQKMEQLQKFEARLQNVEKQAHRTTSMLEKILYEGVPEKKLEPNQAQILEREKAIKSKVKKEMLQSFQSEKQTIIKDAEQHYQGEISTLKVQIVELKKEVKTLKEKNENIYNLLQEFQKENKAKSQLEEKPQKMEICNPGPDNGPEDKIQTQSMIEIRPSQSQTNQIHFLEEKTERLEDELKECKANIDVYKKEIRYILETYKPKNTKLKLIRCNECLIRINEKAEDSFKCEKCKLDIHDSVCAKIHEKNCKRNIVTNKAKPKKTETKPPSTGLSQRLDYF